MNKFSPNTSGLMQASSMTLLTTEIGEINGDNGGAVENEADIEITDPQPDPIEKLKTECWDRLNHTSTQYETGGSRVCISHRKRKNIIYNFCQIE